MKDQPGKSAEAFWILSKKKVLSEEIQKKTDDYIEQYFDKNAIRVAKQDSNV